jgi:hypothetical protein
MVIVSLFLNFSLLFVFLSFHQNPIKDISSVALKFEISLPAVEHFSSYEDFTYRFSDIEQLTMVLETGRPAVRQLQLLLTCCKIGGGKGHCRSKPAQGCTHWKLCPVTPQNHYIGSPCQRM